MICRCPGFGLKRLVCLLDNLNHSARLHLHWICDLHDRNITGA